MFIEPFVSGCQLSANSLSKNFSSNRFVISKLLRLGVGGYKSIFPHVSTAIQLSSQGWTPMRGENIQYIYTNSKHKNPLCRVIPVLKHKEEEVVRSHDKEKYCDLLLDAAETVLGYFGFDDSLYRKSENKERSNKKKKWWDELREERRKDVEAEREN